MRCDMNNKERELFYTIMRYEGEIIFLPNIIDYGDVYNQATLIKNEVNADIVTKLISIRSKTPFDKIFDLDMTLKPFYRDRYTAEEINKINFQNAINHYQNELLIANKFFQEYNFGLSGTQNDMNEVQTYLKAIRLTENDYAIFDSTKEFIRPAILYQYD